jgi:hypothetical protein
MNLCHAKIGRMTFTHKCVAKDYRKNIWVLQMKFGSMYCTEIRKYYVLKNYITPTKGVQDQAHYDRNKQLKILFPHM